MPRSRRMKSPAGLYHIIMRGINREFIFSDDEDHRKYLRLLVKYQKECGFTLYAWCIMSNHVHLLLREGEVPVSEIFRKLGTSYVYWYNSRHGRVGHLFQDRFKSQIIDSVPYFLHAIRYIHLNPVKAGICKDPGEYLYSSYRDYFGEESIVDAKYVLQYMSRNEFVAFHHVLSPSGEAEKDSNYSFIEMNENVSRRVTDEELKGLIIRSSGCDSAWDFLNLSDERQCDVIWEMLCSGASVRQLSRLTARSECFIRRVRDERAGDGSPRARSARSAR